MADFDPTSLGAVAVEDAPADFDPSSIGAVAVEDDFTPESIGAVAVETPQPQTDSGQIRQLYNEGRLSKDTALRLISSMGNRPEMGVGDQVGRIAYETAKGMTSTAAGLVGGAVGTPLGAAAGTAVAGPVGGVVGGAAGALGGYTVGSMLTEKGMTAAEDFLAGKSETFAAGLSETRADPLAGAIGQTLPMVALGVPSAAGYLATNAAKGLGAVGAKAAGGVVGEVLGAQAVTGVLEQRLLTGEELLSSIAEGAALGGMELGKRNAIVESASTADTDAPRKETVAPLITEPVEALAPKKERLKTVVDTALAETLASDPLSAGAETPPVAPADGATGARVETVETPLDSAVISVPEGATGYKVKSGRATGTAYEYADRIVLKDIVSLDAGKGEGTAVIDALKAKGKPIELTAGKRSGDTPTEALTAFYTKRGFVPVKGQPGSFRWEPPAKLSALAETPVPAPSAQGAAGDTGPVTPKLRQGQKQGDLLGGSEDLTLVGEKVVEKSATPKTPEPTVTETVSEAVRAYGDITSAHEHLQKQIDALSADPKQKATVTRMRAAQRQIEHLEEQESRRETQAEHDQEMEGKYELISAIKNMGGLPTLGEQGKYATGELRRVMEAKKGAFLNLFRKGANSLDKLRERLGEVGFDFETPHDMIAAIEDSLTTGRKRYGTQFPPGYLGGPGAMGPVEASAMQAESGTTGLKKATVRDERIQRGLDDLPPAERQPEEARVQRAEDRVDNDPTLAPSLIARIVDQGQTAVSPDDAAVLLVERTRTMNERKAWESEEMRAETQEAQFDAQEKLTEIEARLERLDQAQRVAGSSWGRVGHLYQRMMREDFSLEAMERKARVAKEGPLTPEERATIKQQADDIAKQKDEIDRLKAIEEKAAEDAEISRTYEDTIKELEADIAGRPKFGKEVFEIARGIVNRWKAEADAVDLDIRGFLGSEVGAVGDVGPQKGKGLKLGRKADERAFVTKVAIKLRAKIGEFGLNFAESSTALIAEYGAGIQPYLKKAWVQAQGMIGKEKVSPRVKAEVKKGVKKKDEKAPVDILARAKAEAEAGEELSHKTVYEIARGHVNEGMRGEEAVMKATHETVKEAYPDASERDVRRAFSEYGKVKFPSKDASAAELRELRTLVRLQESIDRATKDSLDPLHTGLQRDKASQAVREKTKELNELLKKRQGPPSPEKLASNLEARKNALRNRIEDLDKQLRTGEKPTTSKPAPLDAEGERLTAERNAMVEKLREIEEGENPRPPEHEQALARLQDRIDETRDRLARLEINRPPGKATVDTKEIAEAKAELKQLTETISELRKPVPKSAADKQLESLSKIRNRLDETLAGERDPKAPKDFNPLTAAAADIKAEIIAMQELAAQMRRDSKPKSDPNAAKEKAQIKALEDAIERYRQKTATGDFTAKGKVQGPDTRKVAALKEIRDSRRAAYDAARKAGKPVRTPEEIYNAARLKGVRKQMTELETRIKAGDFTRRTKPEPKAKSDELIAEELKLQSLQQDFNKGLHEAELKNRTTGKKIWDAIQRTRGAIVNIKSSFDFSAPRQALVAILANTTRLATNPISGARLIGSPIAKMFKAWSNEQRARAINHRLQDRPNAKSGADKIAGLEFTDLETLKFTKHEENAHSVLDEWAALPFRTGNAAKSIVTAIPKAGAKAVRMSNRAFVTFLNVTRAELFDEMLRVNFKDRAPTKAELQVIGNMVNIATGRGKMNPMASRLGSEVLWAPKLLASRVQFLTGQPLWTGKMAGTRRARAIVAKEYARVIVGGFLLAQVARLFDEKKEEEPTSSDFGKIVRGNTRIDPWGGFQQVTTFSARAVTGKTKPLEGKERKNDLGNLVMSFARNKLRPDLGALWNAYDVQMHRTKPGRPTSLKETATDAITPLPMNDIVGIMKAHGFTEGMIVEALGQFGAGVQRYDEEDKIKATR